jgi:hypothetical protein
VVCFFATDSMSHPTGLRPAILTQHLTSWSPAWTSTNPNFAT